MRPGSLDMWDWNGKGKLQAAGVSGFQDELCRYFARRNVPGAGGWIDYDPSEYFHRRRNLQPPGLGYLIRWLTLWCKSDKGLLYHLPRQRYRSKTDQLRIVDGG
jgi:hypothetical protein